LNGEILKTMARRVGLLQQLSVDSPSAAATVIGRRFDPACHEVRDFLSRNRIVFSWVDPDDPAADDRALGGADGAASSLPVVILADGRRLEGPSFRELAGALGLKTVPAHDAYDVAIV